MNKTMRTFIGVTLLITGVILTIIPGSILIVAAGLFLLSMDHEFARRWLKVVQKTIQKGARKADAFIARRR